MGFLDGSQIVSVTPGLDTRPFRQDWPRGTILYDIAPREMHTLCQKRIDASISTGSLHIPVAVEVTDVLSLPFRVTSSTQDFCQLADRLERSGFRGDRLSVWAIQVIQPVSQKMKQKDLCDVRDRDGI